MKLSLILFVKEKKTDINSMNSVVEKANPRDEINGSSEFEAARLRTLQEAHRMLDQALKLEDAITRVFMLLDERHKLQSCMLLIAR